MMHSTCMDEGFAPRRNNGILTAWGFLEKARSLLWIMAGERSNPSSKGRSHE